MFVIRIRTERISRYKRKATKTKNDRSTNVNFRFIIRTPNSGYFYGIRFYVTSSGINKNTRVNILVRRPHACTRKARLRARRTRGFGTDRRVSFRWEIREPTVLQLRTLKQSIFAYGGQRRVSSGHTPPNFGR